MAKSVVGNTECYEVGGMSDKRFMTFEWKLNRSISLFIVTAVKTNGFQNTAETSYCKNNAFAINNMRRCQ